MQKKKFLIKKLNYFILSNGTMYKNTLLLNEQTLKIKVNTLKKYLKIKTLNNNNQD